MMTTQQEIRDAFWDAVAQGQYRGMNVTRKQITDYSGKGKMHNTDTRTAFCDFVDALNKNGEISEGLADKVTL